MNCIPKLKQFFSLILGLLIGHHLKAQNGNNLFNDTILHELHISISIPNWNDTLQSDYNKNSENEALYPEIYRPCDLILDGDTLLNSGIRTKGNFSNTINKFQNKKPLKIAFDAFENQKHDGIKKINLNNFTNDPSLVHEALVFKLMRENGVPASRVAFVKVYVNGAYFGLYEMVENVDKTFLEYHFGKGNKNGNLYKTGRESAVMLDYLGEDSTAYQNKNLVLKTDDSWRSWNPYISFVKSLKRWSKTPQKDSLIQAFPVETYLKVLAIEKLVRSWDSYWGGGNNFYLYAHPDGRIYWIPWDFNESFQNVRFLNFTNIQDSYLVPLNKSNYRPLLEAIFTIPELQTLYLTTVCNLIQSSFTEEHMGPIITKWHELIEDAYQEDPNKLNSFDAFKKSLYTRNKDVIKLNKSGFQVLLTYDGLFPFIENQREWAIEQLGMWDFNCTTKPNSKEFELKLFPNPASGYVNLQFTEMFNYGEISIYNSSGVQVKKWPYSSYTNQPFSLSLEGISAGFYYVVFRSGSGSLGRSKLVVF